MYTYFTRSMPKKKKLAGYAQQERDTLATLVEINSDLYEQHGWQLVSLKCIVQLAGPASM